MKLLVTILLTCVLTVPAFAGYTYVITDGMQLTGLTLRNDETLLMTGGAINYNALRLTGSSYAKIDGTSSLGQGSYPIGGVTLVIIEEHGHLDFLGGEIWELNMGYGSTASFGTTTLSGGRIDRLRSYQQATLADKHIEIICKEWDYNTITKMLTGIWGDDSSFAIQLVDVQGYTPTIDNINFVIIPEPASLLFLAAGGGILLRRYRR